MKKAIFIAVFLSIGTPVLAYDAVTPTESILDFAPNANFLLKEQYQQFCFDEPLHIENQIADVKKNPDGLADWKIELDLRPYYSQLQTAATQCDVTKSKIESIATSTLQANRNIGCGTDYVKRGGTCITPTQACQLYFGYDVTGEKSRSAFDTAECTCNAGSTFTGGKCVAQVQTVATPQTAAVANATTEAQLQQLIVQLTAQVASLLAQINALMGR